MVYYADGFCFGSNPSKTGGGYTVVDCDDNLIICHKVYKEHFTNNEAELLACVAALRICGEKDTVIVDSTTIISWVFNIHKKLKSKSGNRKDLNELKLEANNLVSEKSINLIWKPREVNLAGLYNEREFHA